MHSQYCSKGCQTTDWKTHKHDCKSPLGKRTWLPAWYLGDRRSAILGEGDKYHHFNRKYLFGNMPALDVLNLGQNEGLDFRGDLNVLFAGKCNTRRYDSAGI